MLGMAAFPKLSAGDRIRVSERVVGYDQTWLTHVEGEVVSCEPETTGSWFAQAKHNKLWLLRIRLRKDDGEITALNVDQNTEIQILSRTT